MTADHASAAVDATADDALGSDDVTALRERLTRGDVSAGELREAAVARVHAVNGRLNAVTCWTDPPAVPAAGVREGALAGMPTVIKDNEDLQGYLTTQGSWAVPDRRARSSSPWVTQALRLGLAPVAKTTMPEFGLTATTETVRFGATRNPWDTERSSGGSSGGSAALVAAGAVPIAHANDGGGSIRIPAACCGLVGLKPSRGRLVDLPELDRLPVPITVQGVLTRTVRDTALYFAEAEKLWQNPQLPPIGRLTHPDGRRLRVGLVLASIAGLPIGADVLAATTAAGELCQSLGHHVEQTAPAVPDQFGPDFLRYWALVSFGLKNAGRLLFGPGFDSQRTEEFTKGMSRYLVRRAERLPGSLRRLRRLAREHEAAYSRFDVLVSPVLGHEPPPIGHLGPEVEFHTHLVRLLRYSSFTPLQNISGSPAISLPLGRSATGLPVGVQFAAPFGHEGRLLSLAYELEAAAPWPTRVA
jgi:amidase